MHGPVFFAIGAVVLLALGLVVGITPFLLVPVVAIIVGTVFAVPVAKRLASSKFTAGPGETGVPTTREASYDPQIRPQ